VTVTQIQLYNGALFRAGVRRIANLSVNEESRLIMDDIWNEGVVQHCLEQGQWRFALRTVQIDKDDAFTPSFGYQYRFDKPDDFVRLTELCTDEHFKCPLLLMQDEGSHWLADITPIYVRYVSNGASYGLNYGLWPDSFAEYVKWRMAWLAIPRLKDSTTDKQEAERSLKNARDDALSKDAMKEPTKFPPPGAWVSSRLQGGDWRRSRAANG
jgi:hypothetical protein